MPEMGGAQSERERAADGVEATADDVQYELVPITDLIPHPGNARRGNVEAIADSIREHGFYGGIIVQRSTNRIIVGNHRWQAAKEVGLDAIPVHYLDVDDAEAARILLVDNRSSDLATYDDSALAELLKDLDESDEGLVGTGFGQDDLDEMLSRLDADRKQAPTTGLPESVVATHLIFDSVEQQRVWYDFTKFLKRQYPDAETLGERLGLFLPGLIS